MDLNLFNDFGINKKLTIGFIFVAALFGIAGLKWIRTPGKSGEIIYFKQKMSEDKGFFYGE